jgi:O-antigen/teichoic acid export membrane protein
MDETTDSPVRRTGRPARMGHNAHSMRTRYRHTSALAFGSVVSGLLAYCFFAVVTRDLGSTAAAPVSVLWASWSFAGAALTFPLQHWIARSVSAHHGERSVREALRGVALLSVAVAAVISAASWAARDLLFHSGEVWFPLLMGAVTLGSAVMGMVRGVLAARGRFMAIGVGLVAENALRFLAALALTAAGVEDPVAYGLCLLVGYAATAGWPSTFRLSRSGSAGESESPLAFLGGAAGGQLLGQAVLTGGPVALALAGGSAADITALFAGLALFRVPYTLALGVVFQLTGRLTSLVVQRRQADLRRIRHWVLAITLVGALGAALVGALLGPPLLRLIFGADVKLPSGLTLVIAVGSTVAMANLVVTLVVLAQGRTLGLVRAWLVALVPGIVWFAAAGVDVLDRTCWAFLVIEAAAFGLLVREEMRGTAALGQRAG